MINEDSYSGPQRGGSAGAHEFKQVESCFLNHNSSIHFCCTDSSLLMTHGSGLSSSIIIWRIGGGGHASFCPGGPKLPLVALVVLLVFLEHDMKNMNVYNVFDLVFLTFLFLQ